MKVQDIQARENQQDHFDPEGDGVVALEWLGKDEQASACEHHRKTAHGPRLKLFNHVRDGTLAHGEFQESQIQPHHGPDGESESKNVDGLDDGKRPVGFAKVYAYRSVIEPLDEG